MKKIVRLTENDLHRIVKNSVKRIMKESYFDGNMGSESVDNGEHNECMRIMSQLLQAYSPMAILTEFGNLMGYDEWCQYVREVERRLNDRKKQHMGL